MVLAVHAVVLKSPQHGVLSTSHKLHAASHQTYVAAWFGWWPLRGHGSVIRVMDGHTDLGIHGRSLQPFSYHIPRWHLHQHEIPNSI